MTSPPSARALPLTPRPLVSLPVAIAPSQLAALERPFAGMDMQRFSRQVVEGGQRPPLKKGWPPQLGILLEECWHEQPARRPQMLEVCQRLSSILEAAGGGGAAAGGAGRTARTEAG